MIEIDESDIKTNPKVHQLTHHYQDKISGIFFDLNNMNCNENTFIDSLNNIIETYERILSIHKNDLNDIEKQKKTFEQIIYLLNNLCRNELSIRYFNNSLSKNNLKAFKNKTIGDKIYRVIPSGEGNAGCCWHLSMILKQFFDILESQGLKISSHLFIEKRNFDNHTGVLLKFDGKFYLIDPYINGNFLVPVSDLGQDIQDRMKQIMSNDNESMDINSMAKIYSENNKEFFKVIIKNNEDLFQILRTVSNQTGYIRMYDIDLSNFPAYYLRFQFFKNGILVSNKFFYEFNNKLNEDDLNKTPDEVLSYLFSIITHKIDKKQENRITEVSEFEKKFLAENLGKYSNKIDFSRLREILLGNNEYYLK